MVTHQWASRLDDSSVFQAELFAIFSALEWISEHPEHLNVPILSDSLSVLQAIYARRTKNSLVLQIKIKLKSLLYRTSLGHVSAQKGLQGNECADILTEDITTKDTIDRHLLVHESCIKRVLKSRILAKWQDYWYTTYRIDTCMILFPKFHFTSTLSLPTCTNLNTLGCLTAILWHSISRLFSMLPHK